MRILYGYNLSNKGIISKNKDIHKEIEINNI